MEHNWTDDQLIAAIKAGGDARNKAWEYIIRAWRSVHLGVIVKGGGTSQEVDAALSYAVVDVEKQILRQDFALHSASLRTYFIHSLILHWARLSRQSKIPLSIEFDGQEHFKVYEISPEEVLTQEERRQKVRNALAQLGERCKTILTLYGEGYSWLEIADCLKINMEYAEKLAGKCKKKLRELLQGKI